jgi:hypothetical protein
LACLLIPVDGDFYLQDGLTGSLFCQRPLTYSERALLLYGPERTSFT